MNSVDVLCSGNSSLFVTEKVCSAFSFLKCKRPRSRSCHWISLSVWLRSPCVAGGKIIMSVSWQSISLRGERVREQLVSFVGTYGHVHALLHLIACGYSTVCNSIPLSLLPAGQNRHSHSLQICKPHQSAYNYFIVY